MKRRELERYATALLAREQFLFERFIEPNIAVTQWDSHPLDMTASYIGLLHAESEALLERSVRAVLAHGLACAKSGHAHPALINALLYYQGELSSKVGVSLVPKRIILESNPNLVADSWVRLGANVYWEALVDANHGAGFKYLERLIHPLGVSINPKSFSKVCGVGVREIAKAPAGLSTELTEFVLLRGRAVHSSAENFHASVKSMTPQTVRTSGLRAASAISAMTRLIAKKTW